MKKRFLSLFTLMFSFLSFGQPTWSEHAAEVFYNNCTECHNPDGIGTFSLLDYEEAYDYRAIIQSYVTYNIMPPWTADSSFQHYFDERLLTEYERNTIIGWAAAGGLEGDPALAPPPPIYTSDQKLPGTPDLTIEMPLYMSKATEIQDDYICISMPSGLTEDKRVKAIEIIPGNRSIVHHCLLYIDEDGDYETDTIGGNCGGPTTDAFLMTGYTPGATPTIFPSSDAFSAGTVMAEGANVVFAMHYPHGSYGEYDQTKVNFYFYDEPVDNFREIIAGPFIQNWDFDLPANEFTTVHASFDDTPADLSVLSSFPHMHLLGDYIDAYGITPSLDTVPFVRIPHWDFDWQDFYWFRYMQKLPEGSQLKGTAIYNNTSSNIHNPSDPPVNVYPGLNTTDEMFLVYFHIMAYEEGDEFINVDSLNNIYLNNWEDEIEAKNGISVYPNPSEEVTTIEFMLEKESYVSLFIYDMSGKVVKRLSQDKQSSGMVRLNWDGTNDDTRNVSPGVYNYSLLINGVHYNGRVVRL